MNCELWRREKGGYLRILRHSVVGKPTIILPMARNRLPKDAESQLFAAWNGTCH